jgi:hypothetical protein
MTKVLGLICSQKRIEKGWKASFNSSEFPSIESAKQLATTAQERINHHDIIANCGNIKIDARISVFYFIFWLQKFKPKVWLCVNIIDA